MREYILDIIGVLLILLSIYDYFFMDRGFYESTAIGVVGLALFVLKESSIRKFVESFFKKRLD